MKLVECSGTPRDLGRDLGRAQRAEIRAAVAAASRPAPGEAQPSEGRTVWRRGPLLRLWRDRATIRLHRELRRHFPHQSEWLEGLARGAGVSLRALVRELAASCSPDAPASAVLAAAAGPVLRVVCPVPRGALLRRVAPEGRFRSVELALPTASSPHLGVNEAGLAVAVVARGSVPARFAPPVALFARDCLERFERVDPALEWCLARPAAPGGALLLADARGEIAAVDAGVSGRQPLRCVGDWLVLGSPELVTAELAKPASMAGESELESALVTALTAAVPDAAPAVIADPAGRRLRVARGEWVRACV